MRPARIFSIIQLSNSRGRPNMAQAGGKDASGIDAAIAKAAEVLAEQL